MENHIERRTNNNNKYTGLRIYTILINILEFTILLLRFTFELFIQFLKSFVPDKLKDVSEEIVLITGTGHGIGKELALQYTELGCTVVCVDINEKGNLETVEDCNRLGKGKAHAYYCDVSNHDKVIELSQKVKIEIGSITVLVNNAGIMPTHPLEKHSTNEIRRIIDINVLSNFWTIEAFLPHMKERNYGHIVSISSIAGVVGLANLVPYCASKFAVRGMMEALSEELREGPYNGLIKTTTICPYMVNTGLCKKPRIKFPSILGLLDPKSVAAAIIQAHRADLLEATIPRGLLSFNNFCRLIPMTCALMLKDFIDSGVDSDLS